MPACAGTAQGLNSVRAIAVSPDGASVYATSFLDAAIVRLDRSASGTLSNPSCISDVGDPAGCLTTPAEGLAGGSGVAVSPDGTSVYATSYTDSAIVTFDRAAGGALSNPSCISDLTDPAGCGTTAEGLDTASGVAVSPDGQNVYAISIGDDAIVTFDRAMNGALSNADGCIKDVGGAATCGPTADGLANAGAVTVSPDGKSVYVASVVDRAIVRFDRGAGGALSNPSCIEDPPSDAGCGVTTEGLNGAGGVAVSPDGTNLYVTAGPNAGGDDAIVTFDRNSNGALTNPDGCIKDVESTATCGGTAQGLDNPAGVAVRPDDANLYAVSLVDNAIVRFDRAGGGALSNASCIADPPNTAGCGGLAQGLNDANGVAVSPDGTSVYVDASADNTIVRFDRELFPPPPPPAPPEEGGVADTTPPDTTITGGPKKKEKKGKATFSFSSTEPGSTFECKLDDGAFEPCTSPHDVKVKKGKHHFEVRARDAAGNVDPTPATLDWKVKKKKH